MMTPELQEIIDDTIHLMGDISDTQKNILLNTMTLAYLEGQNAYLRERLDVISGKLGEDDDLR